MIDPGQLRHRLVLEEPVETPDGAGGVSRSYQTVTTVWASLTPTAARGAVVAESLGANITHRIVLRGGPDVTTRHRFREGGRIFRILASRDLDGTGRFLEIQAEERVD
jgi:SPP1 family predicted phage head-tail adaptor